MGDKVDQKLLQHIAGWRAAYNDDTTGVLVTIEAMLWDHAAFMTAIKIANLANQLQRATETGSGALRVNSMLFELLAKGYWSTLLIGARRLLDREMISGRRGVYSLRSILRDVRACQPKLTRRVYIECVRECRYDLEVLRQENHAALEAAGTRPIWGNPALTQSEISHKDFDLLSGVNEADRSAVDLIDLAVLDRIEGRLLDYDRISRHVNTHIAHAGNAESRVGKGLDQFDIREARNLLKSLKEVGDLVGTLFANGGISTLASYQGKQFEGLDTAAILKKDIQTLDENWRLLFLDIESWTVDIGDFLVG